MNSPFINWKSIAINSNDLDSKEREILGFSPPYANQHNSNNFRNNSNNVKVNLTDTELNMVNM